MNLGHEGDAEGKSGADDKGLIEFQLASQTHLHNVREQVNRPELWSNPVTEQVKWFASMLNFCLGWSPVGAISTVPEPCFEKPSGSLQVIWKIVKNASQWTGVTLCQAAPVQATLWQVMKDYHFVDPPTMSRLRSWKIKSEHRKACKSMRGDCYPFAVQVKNRVISQQSLVDLLGCLEGRQKFLIDNEDLSNGVLAIKSHGRLLIATWSVNKQPWSNLQTNILTILLKFANLSNVTISHCLGISIITWIMIKSLWTTSVSWLHFCAAGRESSEQGGICLAFCGWLSAYMCLVASCSNYRFPWLALAARSYLGGPGQGQQGWQPVIDKHRALGCCMCQPRDFKLLVKRSTRSLVGLSCHCFSTKCGITCNINWYLWYKWMRKTSGRRETTFEKDSAPLFCSSMFRNQW